LDDDDFYLSSSDESEHSGSTSPDVTTKITSAGQASDAPLPHRSLTTDSGVYNNDEENAAPVVVERGPAYSSTVIVPRNLEFSMEFSESEPDEHSQLRLSAPQTDLLVEQAEVSSSSIVSSQIHDEVASSLESTSNNEKREAKSKPTARTNDEVTALELSSNALLRSVASESGAYDEDAFEEDESIPKISTVPTIVAPQTIVKPEIDPSEDVSEQTEATAFQQALSKVPLEKGYDSGSISGESEHYGVNGDQLALLGSDSSETSGQDCIADKTAGSRTHEIGNRSSGGSEQEFGKSIPEVQHRAPALLERETVVDTEEGRAPDQPAEGCSSAPVHTDCSSSLPKTDRVERPHVTIVREFEFCEGKRMEMKDASTQLTGNHAAIQTDLIPDGMHNLFEPVAPEPSTIASRIFVPANEPQPRDDKSIPCQSDQQPPPPPISPLLGSSTYNMNEFRQPMTTSTSIYKQQLLALQEQILQKKRETERIVHDRMTFQYSSLRGTERVGSLSIFVADLPF
jgi:hypothetical protein